MKYLLPAIIMLICQPIFSQTDYSSWVGNWKGQIENPAALAFEFEAEFIGEGQYQLRLIQASQLLYEVQASVSEKGELLADLGPLVLKAKCDEADKLLFAFLRTQGLYEYSLPLRQKDNIWSAQWLPWHTAVMNPATVYLAVEQEGSGSPQIYPFFDETRFPGTFAAGFEANKMGGISFFDFFTGMQFKATHAEKVLSLQ